MSQPAPDGIMSAQRVLAFDVRTVFDRARLLISPANADAVAWIDRWPDWPAHVHAIYGPEGCGKTHLACVWREAAEAGLVQGMDLDDAFVSEFAAAPANIVLDGADEVAGNPARETALLHLYNLVRESGRFMLLAARDAPARWPVKLPDLASRLGSVPATSIGQPDDSMLGSLMVKLFDDRQLLVPGDVVAYLTSRMERSFKAAETLAAAIDQLSLVEKRPVTIALARAALEAQQQ